MTSTHPTEIPEYEYLDSTPTEGDMLTLLACIASEADYLTGGDPLPQHFTVGCDYWGAGCVRYLIDADTGERIEQAS